MIAHEAKALRDVKVVVQCQLKGLSLLPEEKRGVEEVYKEGAEEVYNRCRRGAEEVLKRCRIVLWSS